MRLIDADAFLKSEIERCGCVPVIGSCTADNEIFKFVLEQQPTVEPVRGEWVNTDFGILCTACRRTWDYFEINPKEVMAFKYCPECGTDMRGEKNNN